MAATYTPIATTTLGSAASSYTFSSIPGTYTDLILIGSHRSTSGINGIHIRFNGDTGTNYSSTLLYGTGSAASSSRYINQTFTSIGYTTTSEYAVIKCQIQNYSNSTTYKSFLSRGGSATYEEDTVVGLWRKTLMLAQPSPYTE
jgi:hypothetical protein